MRVQSVPISRINPAPYNPRRDLRPEDAEYRQLQRSLDEFGCVEPLVWNKRTGNLVGGHQRFKILVARGATYIDVSVLDLPLGKEKALNVALNKIAGRWDQEKLATLLDELAHLPDLDVELTGFEAPEIELAVQSASPLDVESEFDEGASLATPAVTQPGELLELGPHRVLCGDSARPHDIDRLMAGRSAQALFTDPPYNVAYCASNRPAAPDRKPGRGPGWSDIRNDRQSRGRYRTWFARVAASMAGPLVAGAPFYIWNGHANFGLLHDVLVEVDLRPACVLTWAKESFAPGFSDYNEQTEFCLYGWKLGARHPWHGPKNASTLWSVQRDRVQTYQHPTQKALELAERALRNSTRTGDVVLDPFLGSGTTLIAAARLGRTCCGLELEPRYCDVIVRRFIALVGAKAASPALVERYALPGAVA